MFVPFIKHDLYCYTSIVTGIKRVHCFFRFYEWKKDGKKKQPYYIHFKDGRPLVFAALFDSWKNSEG